MVEGCVSPAAAAIALTPPVPWIATVSNSANWALVSPTRFGLLQASVRAAIVGQKREQRRLQGFDSRVIIHVDSQGMPGASDVSPDLKLVYKISMFC